MQQIKSLINETPAKPSRGILWGKGFNQAVATGMLRLFGDEWFMGSTDLDQVFCAK